MKSRDVTAALPPKYEPRYPVALEELAMVEIQLGGERAAGRVALIDDSDAELVRRYKWFVGYRGYVMTNIYRRPEAKYTCIEMQRLLVGKPGYIVDHINKDKLDNRRSNLRACTVSQNGMNRAAPRHNVSGYKGVSFDNWTKTWCMDIQAGKTRVRLRNFKTPEEAAKLYNIMAYIFHGEYAYFNVLP